MVTLATGDELGQVFFCGHGSDGVAAVAEGLQPRAAGSAGRRRNACLLIFAATKPPERCRGPAQTGVCADRPSTS